MNFNKLKANAETVEDIAKAVSKSEFLKLSEDRSTVSRVTPIAESTNVDERTIYVVSEIDFAVVEINETMEFSFEGIVTHNSNR